MFIFQDHWVIHDIGLENGSTLRVILKENVKPTLSVLSAFNGERIDLVEKFDVFGFKVSDLRSIVSKKCGLPISVFRLVNNNGDEMYDFHTLQKYNVTLGDTMRLEVWDGWSDFLNLAIHGFASHVMQSLSPNDIEARFQLKVALHIAAFYGHVDLAVTLLKLGVRPDENVGYHPLRIWCVTDPVHKDSLSAPIHIAASRGNLSVLRSFVHHDITTALARDGNNLTPLSVALRSKQKSCASFLLTQQWKKISFNQKANIPISIFNRMKRWADRARQRAPVPINPLKPSQRAPRRIRPMKPLVGSGILVDGFSENKMTSKNSNFPMKGHNPGENHTQMVERRRRQYSLSQHSESSEPTLLNHDSHGSLNEMEPEQYFKILTNMQSYKLPRLTKIGHVISKAADEKSSISEPPEQEIPKGKRSKKLKGKFVVSNLPKAASTDTVNRKLQLPPIREKSGRQRSGSFPLGNQLVPQAPGKLSLSTNDVRSGESSINGSRSDLNKSDVGQSASDLGQPHADLMQPKLDVRASRSGSLNDDIPVPRYVFGDIRWTIDRGGEGLRLSFVYFFSFIGFKLVFSYFFPSSHW